MSRPASLTLLLALGTAHANVDRTGRTSHGHPSDTVATSIKHCTIQVGGNKAGAQGDLHARYEKDINLGSVRTHFTARFRHPNPKDRLLDSVSVSGNLGDAYYEATRQLGGPEGDLQLGYSLPSGVQLMADAKTDKEGPWHIERLSAFHVAGPFNIQPTWLLPTRTLRVKLGRGGKWNGCPLSLTTDLHPDGNEPTSYEVGVRHEFDRTGMRKLKARLLLPGEATARRVWAEYQDSKVDKNGVWYAKASVPLGDSTSAAELADGLLRKAEFSLRRSWQW